MHIFVTTGKNIEKLSYSREMLPYILESYERTHANGQQVPPTTLDTWKRVQKHMKYLCRQWEQAMTESTRNMFSSAESRALVQTIEVAIAKEHGRVGLTDDTMNNENGGLSRWNNFKRIWANQDNYKHYFAAHEVEAYRAIRKLQNYTIRRGWSTDEDLGKVLGDQELEVREQITMKHLAGVSDSIRNEMDQPIVARVSGAEENTNDRKMHISAYEHKAKICNGYVEIDWATGR